MIVFVAVYLAALMVYWLGRKQKIVRSLALVLASYAFFANWNPWFLMPLIFISVLDFCLGQGLFKAEKPGARVFFLLVSLLANFSIFVALKYIGVLAKIPALFGAPAGDVQLGQALPIGAFLFFMQSVSYTIDVYRKRVEPFINILDYLAFIAFFPRLFAGPLLRAKEFQAQWSETPGLPREYRGLAIFLLISGFVKKTVFADYLAINLVDKVFDLPTLFSTTEVLLAIFGYTIQLYCTLSAYTDIALALGLLLGLRLPANFDFPFQAANLREYWRRWFSSLGLWFRDYVYFSLGGSRAKWRGLAYINLFITMLVAGLWNGLGWTFVIWGLLNGMALALTRAYQQMRKPQAESSLAGTAAGILLTAIFSMLAWAIFRANDLQIVGQLVTILKEGLWKAPNLTLPVIIVLATAAAGMWFPRRLYYKIRELFQRLPLPVQVGAALLAALIIIKISSAGAIPFVYER